MMAEDRARITDHRRAGLALVELIISSIVGAILVFTVGILMDGSHRAWLQTYQAVHGGVNGDAQTVVTTFTSLGRRANRAGYVLYRVNQGIFMPVVPEAGHPDAVLSGAAVEFRYWDVPLDAADSHNLMDGSKLATAYALFYLDGSRLKVDYGPYPPGGVPAGGGTRNTTDVTTVVLAENVSLDGTVGPFSHSTVANTGQGSVRLNILLTDPNTNESTKVVTAALLRNVWPR